MKKILALVLALAMTLSMSAVSFAEPAEAVTYSNFSEHLMAFLNGLNLQEKDLYLAANVQDQTYQLLVGMNDEGVINVMAGQDQQEIGTLQVDDEAAYLSYQAASWASRPRRSRTSSTTCPRRRWIILPSWASIPSS